VIENPWLRCDMFKAPALLASAGRNRRAPNAEP
jgi:hypothetical protein